MSGYSLQALPEPDKRNAIRYVSATSGRFASLIAPQPAPPVADHPQEIRRDQSNGLQRLGTVSALVRGSPDDALAEIRAKAVAAKADYYVVLLVDETIVTGQWYSQAILYRK